MKIGVFGTGNVGQGMAQALSQRGHAVKIGTRDVAAALARRESAGYGQPFAVWAEQHPAIEVVTFQAAAEFGEVLVNATSGTGSLAALEAAGEAELGRKIMLDLANPLDFSAGTVPTLSICNTDSLAETMQRRFPDLRIVKTLNTMNALLMVDPGSLAGGDHTVFVSGNDAEAKAQVSELLRTFGWQDIIDLGDLSTARGTEMLLPLWLRTWGALGNTPFNFKIVRGEQNPG